MTLRGITIVIVLAVAILSYVAWRRNAVPPPAQPGSEAPGPTAGAPSQPMPPPAGSGETPTIETGTNPGLSWLVPPRWTDRGPGTMRLATYAIPGTGGTDDAQCAVYYFGAGQGGSVQANLERWRGEFKDPKEDAPVNINAPGARVTRVSFSGTYLAHAGMMNVDEPVESPGWALLGAIAEGPNGSVFFKLTGPVSTVKSAQHEFDRMLRSIAKQ